MTTLPELFKQMRSDPDNLEKRLAYFEALADGRLSDYYAVREHRDDLAYELNQVINYLITIEQGKPLRPIADTIKHLVAVLRNMNDAIDELNATKDKP